MDCAQNYHAKTGSTRGLRAIADARSRCGIAVAAHAVTVTSPGSSMERMQMLLASEFYHEHTGTYYVQELSFRRRCTSFACCEIRQLPKLSSGASIVARFVLFASAPLHVVRRRHKGSHTRQSWQSTWLATAHPDLK